MFGHKANQVANRLANSIAHRLANDQILLPKKWKNYYRLCSHLPNTVAIWHAAVGAGCWFWLDPALVHYGCCGRGSASVFVSFFIQFSTISAVFASGLPIVRDFPFWLRHLHPFYPASPELPVFLRHTAVSRINYHATQIFVRDLCSSLFLCGQSRVYSRPSFSSIRMIWAAQFANIVSSL